MDPRQYLSISVDSAKTTVSKINKYYFTLVLMHFFLYVILVMFYGYESLDVVITSNNNLHLLW